MGLLEGCFATMGLPNRMIHDQILKGQTVLGPFRDDEWELAKWLIKNVGHNQADTSLKLPIVSDIAWCHAMITYH